MATPRVKLRLTFVDSGEFYSEDVSIPGEAMERNERLLDCLQEDPEVLRELHVDLERLVSARRLEG